MTIVLDAIKFNHDSGSATVDALNIRRNATQFVSVPEWVQGVSSSPEQSPAAYSIEETRGRTLTIQARFHRVDRGTQPVEIRALDANGNPPGNNGCLGWLLRWLWVLLRLAFGNVLGEVKSKTVTFSSGGDSGYQTFQLSNPRLWSAGVGVRTTEWRWQYREPSGSWTDFETTRHRVYSLLRVPKAPWQQIPYVFTNTQLPWTEVLDYACRWAQLTGDRDTAAAAVTRSVYQLGPAVVEYDCPGGGSTRYANPSFNCTAFLERLSGGVGNGQYVNCTDCATIVSTFSNALGCDLWQSRMYSSVSFGLNPLLAIGSNVWQTACGWGAFNYHEVAWKNNCTADDEVFDACLQVDGDVDPTSSPHTALLPLNLRFGNPGDNQYRDRLANPAGRPNCEPQPSTRTRRSVF